ncbi:acyltransferase family protein [Nocardioides lianchengensis]|uniref:Peptidoglycan/LPS O-acetylase OafA/YrhL, contains acyltransferase and SGNH-hydrolase domains n=1 Tax=Nocardioides lianchengensis TaxID=1045774 RepID=A0A1G6R004_9ACTN|nr:acyltransferase [Nocardioides lianchengensis]NYG10425.1 peptidoglycan/LPS O-acetylase OafA/YrhL [Nocardioides lianchengensis]SDC97763.1 Peptidoglycan/LPS O-acetylase OafA/YrhL, contains acyltransferase and SGNH-hydrolase domains [Nocardioides lianchengensis]
MSEAAARAPHGATRVAALDGLRGITILLVVLGHGTVYLWPATAVLDVPYLRGFFLGGTVTVFFIVGGYVVTRGLVRELEAGVCDPLRFYLRRLLRLGPQLVLLCTALLLVDQVGPEPTRSAEQTRDSFLHVLTYTWNVYLQDHALDARGDLGHLWYLSVQQQVYVVLPLFLALLIRRRALSVLLLAAGIVSAVVLRFVLVPEIGWWPVSLRVLTRWDGLLLGVLLALVLPRVTRGLRWVPAALVVSLVALVALILTAGESGELAFLRWWGLAVLVVSGALVGLIVLHPGTGAIRALTAAPLTVLGRASYSIYVWHFPVFWFVGTQAQDWFWYARAMLALLIVVPIVVVMEIFVERPVRRLLAERPFFRVRADGTAPAPAGAERVAM